MMGGQVREGNANPCVRPRYDREECRKLSLRKDLWERANLAQYLEVLQHPRPAGYERREDAEEGRWSPAEYATNRERQGDELNGAWPGETPPTSKAAQSAAF